MSIGGLELINNLIGNLYLEELNLYGNDMTDCVIPPLIQFVQHPTCKVYFLSLGSNDFNSQGISPLIILKLFYRFEIT